MTNDNSKHDDDLETRSADGSSKDKQPLPTIDRIASFRIDKTISSGGGGTVFLAYDESMKRKVALKVLHPSLSIMSPAQERFAREAWIAGQLEHANIIKVYSRGEEKQLHYIAMEFADGGSLSDYIKNLREAVSATNDITATANREHIKFIVSKFIELVGALEHIHSRGFIHRDIKPHNILLSGESKTFKLTDFGIAHAEDMTRMTKAGDFMGTIHYMSPEQISAHRTKVDKRTDIYSLGVTLYEALTLSLPFEGDSEEKLIGEIIAGHYIPARKRSKTIPKDLETVLIKATHHDPQRRYQSATDFAEDLRRFSEDRPILAKRDNVFYRARKSIRFNKKSTLIGLALIVIAIASGIIKEQQAQTIRDNEKILSSLQRAVETKTSPFEFEPDWTRLSKILLEHVKKGVMDSTMMWFLNTASIPYHSHKNYVMLNLAKIITGFTRIRIFDSLSEPNFPQVLSYSIVEYMLESNSEPSKYYCYYHYSMGHAAHSKASVKLADYDDTTQSLRIIPIRVITQHYLGASIFENSMGLKVGINLQEIPGSLLKKFSKLDSDFFVTDPQYYFILNDNDSAFSEPLYVDTIIDTVQMWTFDDWPKDFPKKIEKQSPEDTVYADFSIHEFTIVKKRNRFGEKLFEINVTGYVGEYKGRILPLAGDFYIFAKNDNDTLISGQLVRSWSRGLKLYYSLDFVTLDFESFRPNISDFNRLSQNTSEKDIEWWSTFSDIGIDSLGFGQLATQGTIDASLVIVPSLKVARKGGHIEKFWGDTLKFNITFQAIDSTNIN